jgi:2-polyprenyl-3-methyl-5-hydroxy-6-metoxy-1,4-benzoquinol methylase
VVEETSLIPQRISVVNSATFRKAVPRGERGRSFPHLLAQHPGCFGAAGVLCLHDQPATSADVLLTRLRRFCYHPSRVDRATVRARAGTVFWEGLAMTAWSVNELETVACDHCDDRQPATVITRPDGLTVVECPVCGLAYLNPRPTAERIARMYDAEYFAKAEAGESPERTQAGEWIGYAAYTDAAESALRTTIMRQRLEWVLGLLPANSDRRVLEIGCATGEFTAAAHQQGVAITGIDIAAAPIRMAQQRHPGVDFRVSDIASLAQTGAQFEAIVAFEVIEHVTSPRSFLESCSRVLAPGGVLVYSTPNYRKARVLKEAWIGYHMSFEHLYFFSDETLARMGHAAGLEVAAWKTTGTGTLPPPNEGARGWLKQTLQATGLLPLVRNVRTRLRALGTGETYEEFGSGHTLLMAFRKPATSGVQTVRRAA